MKTRFLILGLLLFLLCTACTNANGIETSVGAHFRKVEGTLSSKINLAIASTPRERQKGLMFVKSLPENQGMLFVFPKEDILSFWMKNTYIALDMIFLDKELKVQGVLHNVPMLNTTPRRIGKKGLYVLELAAGVAKKLAVEEGDTLVLDDTLPKAY